MDVATLRKQLSSNQRFVSLLVGLDTSAVLFSTFFNGFGSQNWQRWNAELIMFVWKNIFKTYFKIKKNFL